MIRRIACIILAMLLLTVPFVVFAAGEQETVVFHVDSINGTRWADLICVYKDVPHTNQNEWGENIVVSAEGKVVEKIAGGDIKGKNLAVPEGGMVVSGTLLHDETADFLSYWDDFCRICHSRDFGGLFLCPSNSGAL